MVDYNNTIIIKQIVFLQRKREIFIKLGIHTKNYLNALKGWKPPK